MNNYVSNCSVSRDLSFSAGHLARWQSALRAATTEIANKRETAKEERSLIVTVVERHAVLGAL